MTDLRYITRCDYDHARGYWVRFKQRTPFAAQKFFSDAKLGGQRRALKAAMAYRDELVDKRPDDAYGLQPNSGTLKFVWRTQGPWQYLICLAEIQIAPRKRLKRSWSVPKYGETAAKRKAREWLTQQQAAQLRSYAKHGVTISPRKATRAS